MSTPTPTRIYVVTHKTSVAGSIERRLVRAANQAQAVRHVAKDQIVATVASQDDLVALVGNGVMIEIASNEVLPVGTAA